MRLLADFEVPMRVINCTNAGEHNMVRSRRVKRTRQEFVSHCRARQGLPFVRFFMPPKPRTYAVARWEPPYPPPLVITMTRLSARRFDDDGAVASMKPIRDQLAELLGVNDNDARITWVVKQESRRMPGVRVQIETPEGGAT